MKPFILSADLGQVNDYTAYSIIEERTEIRETKTPDDIRNETSTRIQSNVYALRHLERPPLGTKYDKLVEQVYALQNTPQLAGRSELVVDATGVGRPVIDMMVRAGLKPIPILITSGNALTQDEYGYYHVPKIDIVSALNVAFNSKRLKIANGLPLAPILVQEAQTFMMKKTKAGNDTYEALREGDHDDLVLSVGMAVWWAFFTRKLDVKSHVLKKKKADDYDILHY